MGNQNIIDELISDINEFAEQEREKALEDQSSYAEYVSSFGYGDADKDEIRSKLKDCLGDSSLWYLTDDIKDDDLFAVIGEFVTIEASDIYATDNELYSVIIGEMECQLDDNLTTRIEALTEDEKQAVYKGVNEFMNDSSFIYINMNYDRIVMIFDVDAFVDQRKAA